MVEKMIENEKEGTMMQQSLSLHQLNKLRKQQIDKLGLSPLNAPRQSGMTLPELKCAHK